MTPAQAAREAAGLTLVQAARRVGVSASYLRRMESTGGFSYVLACRLAALYRCGMDPFLFGKDGKRRSNGKTNNRQEVRSAGRSKAAPNRTKDAGEWAAK